ncbi:phosphomevalonate kinase [Alloscardovia criceti]|uniref:phosphomevalonate kinase n=1 Tax=Alloscardovia criceti TaxID=356828 RepID=UPI000374C36F|nr:phosphomevalonate kinase [Alloscardovia criceti]
MAKGKLYLCGEYAVVDGGAAVISAVDRDLNVHLVPAEMASASAYILHPENEVPQLEQGHEFYYVTPATYIAWQLLNELGETETVAELFNGQYALEFESHLVETDGRKYGLGSSGAVTVAVLDTLLAALELPREKIYKLAVMSLLLAQDNGSFGDVACIACGQLVYYVRPALSFLARVKAALLDGEKPQPSIRELVESPWEGLIIEKLLWPQDIDARIGWTGSPASSAALVNSVRSYKLDHSAEYQQFIEKSTAIAQDMRRACHNANTEDFLDAYARASALMVHFSRINNGYMETLLLEKLRTIAESLGYIAKFSGAGGGDCGIALAPTDAKAAALEQAWSDHGISAMNWKLL